jgi:hypothetical protein
MQEDEVVRYISPEQCTHREAELGGQKKEIFMQADTGGRLRQVNRYNPPEADVSNTYKLRLAFQRRSLALDQFNLIPFDVSEAYHEYLFDLMLQPVLHGYNAISVPQIIQADKMIWTFMSTHCRQGISRRPDGTLPMQEALKEARSSPLVMAALQPLPKSSGGFDRKGKGKYDNGSQSSGSRDVPYSYKGGKDKGKGKGGKHGKAGKANNARSYLPKDLAGGKTVTADGSRICFSYNLGNCQLAKPGQSCFKGLHVCCGCESPDHGFLKCTKKN